MQVFQQGKKANYGLPLFSHKQANWELKKPSTHMEEQEWVLDHKTLHNVTLLQFSCWKKSCPIQMFSMWQAFTHCRFQALSSENCFGQNGGRFRCCCKQTDATCRLHLRMTTCQILYTLFCLYNM